jgi:hypothetical protein
MHWEHMIVELHDQSKRVGSTIGKWGPSRMPDAKGVLNALGAEGWEVVAAQGGTHTNIGQVIPKRPRA